MRSVNRENVASLERAPNHAQPTANAPVGPHAGKAIASSLVKRARAKANVRQVKIASRDNVDLKFLPVQKTQIATPTWAKPASLVYVLLHRLLLVPRTATVRPTKLARTASVVPSHPRSVPKTATAQATRLASQGRVLLSHQAVRKMQIVPPVKPARTAHV